MPLRKEDFGNLITRTAKWTLACAGLLALFYCASVWVGASHAQQQAASFGGKPEPTSPHEATTSHPTQDAVIGRLEIPALHISAPITNGIGNAELRHGVGHIPGTAALGGLGTLGLAGHRDTYFRRLKGARNGMQIVISSSSGTFRYQIDRTEIVQPEQVDVLNVVQRPELALVTCYPFEYIGAAPRRFIVQAHLLSAAPDGNE